MDFGSFVLAASTAGLSEEPAAHEHADAECVLDTAREANVSVIVSAHDIEGMPGRDGIRRAPLRTAAVGDVAEFAGTAGSVGDALDLLAILRSLVDRLRAGEMGEGCRKCRAGRLTGLLPPSGAR